MRTIDADALRDKLQSFAYDDWNQGVTTSWANAYNECADIVADMPTVEPPRMRGKWETIEGWDEDEVYRCSECGEEYVLIDGTPKENGYHFCPNCGADMREIGGLDDEH